jgi:hypothetical protein
MVTRSSRSQWAVIAVAAVAVFGGSAATAYSHPLHTTLTEVSVAPDGQLQIVLRAFVDDFSAAVTGRPGPMSPPIAIPTDSAIARYLAGVVSVSDAGGRRVGLAVVSARRSGDLLWITLRAPVAPAAVGVRLTNRVLFERYDDQVNIVQTSIAGRRRTLLFTKRDGAGAKAI